MRFNKLFRGQAFGQVAKVFGYPVFENGEATVEFITPQYPVGDWSFSTQVSMFPGLAPDVAMTLTDANGDVVAERDNYIWGFVSFDGAWPREGEAKYGFAPNGAIDEGVWREADYPDLVGLEPGKRYFLRLVRAYEGNPTKLTYSCTINYPDTSPGEPLDSDGGGEPVAILKSDGTWEKA